MWDGVGERWGQGTLSKPNEPRLLYPPLSLARMQHLGDSHVSFDNDYRRGEQDSDRTNCNLAGNVMNLLTHALKTKLKSEVHAVARWVGT